MERKIREFHKSISKELEATKDRVRHLIGESHWQSDGEHKESVLRGVIRRHVPEVYHVGRGFVFAEEKTSTQIDILITDINRPTLFKDGDFRIVTPEAVMAIIEVKTSTSKIGDGLSSLAKNAEMIRASGIINDCWAGLFVYDRNSIRHKTLLAHLAEAANGSEARRINCAAVGPDLFARFWKKGSEVDSPIRGEVWHSYDLKNLSYGYFIGNLIVEYLDWERSYRSQHAWFPEEGGKETKRKYYVPLSKQDRTPRKF